MIAIALFFCCAGERFVMFASAGIRSSFVPKWSFLLAASELWWGQLYLDEFELSWDGNDLRFNPYESQRIYPATDLPIIGATLAWILPFVGKIRLKWSFWIKFRKGIEKKNPELRWVPIWRVNLTTLNKFNNCLALFQWIKNANSNRNTPEWPLPDSSVVCLSPWKYSPGVLPGSLQGRVGNEKAPPVWIPLKKCTRCVKSYLGHFVTLEGEWQDCEMSQISSPASLATLRPYGIPDTHSLVTATTTTQSWKNHGTALEREKVWTFSPVC